MTNYFKEKLQMGISAALVTSGLTIVVVRRIVTAKIPMQSVVEWKEVKQRGGRMEMPSVWGWTSENLARIQAAVDAQEAREAEKIGRVVEGKCNYCGEEIVKNEGLNGVWESESLVGYCPDARDHKHVPKGVK